jgi:hypothetical protein
MWRSVRRCASRTSEWRGRADEHEALPPGAVTALLFAFPAAGAERLPTAGAPHYLHWGADGLCISLTDWDDVSGIVYDPATRIVAVAGKPNATDFLEITIDAHGTSSAWDDTLEMRLESFDAEGPPDVEVLDPPLPLYEPGDQGGGGGVWTTENTPKTLYLKRIEFLGSMNDSNGVTNDSQVPMYARGFFGEWCGGLLPRRQRPGLRHRDHRQERREEQLHRRRRR